MVGEYDRTDKDVMEEIVTDKDVTEEDVVVGDDEGKGEKLAKLLLLAASSGRTKRLRS